MLSEHNYTRRRTAYEAIVAHGALVIPMSPAAGPGWDTPIRTSASIIWTERFEKRQTDGLPWLRFARTARR